MISIGTKAQIADTMGFKHLLGAVDALDTRGHNACLRNGKGRNDENSEKGLVHFETSPIDPPHAYFLRQRHAGRAVRAAAATSASIHTRARANGMHEI
jgi:hypothetical protein